MGYTINYYEFVDVYALDWERKNAVSTGFSNRSATGRREC